LVLHYFRVEVGALTAVLHLVFVLLVHLLLLSVIPLLSGQVPALTVPLPLGHLQLLI
jgi:hypothetical protein